MDPRDNIPWLYRMPTIAHYYGDTVRKLFLAAAVLMLIGAPLYSDDISAQGTVLVLASLVLAIVAGVMSPQMRIAKFASVIISIVGTLIFELWALGAYNAAGFPNSLFVVREIIALTFFFALYFSLKTARSEIVEQLVFDTDTDGDLDRGEEMHKIDQELSEPGDSLVDGNI